MVDLLRSAPTSLECPLPNCWVVNNTGATIPAHSPARVTGPQSNNTADPGPLKNQVTVSVIKPVSPGDGPLISTGPLAIPNGKSGPGWIGSLLPITATATVGLRYRVAGGGWSLEEYETGDLLCVDSGKNGVALFLYGPGGTGRTELIRFSFADQTSSGSGSGSSGSSSSDGDACFPTAASEPYIGTVIVPVCGGEMPDDMDADGNVELSDPIGLLTGRELSDMIGREGVAVRMKIPEEEAASGSSAPLCEWVIIYVDFHRWVTVVTDFIVGVDSITIKRKNVKVWDDCSLPDEIIAGTDCPTGSSSSSSSGV